MAPPKKVSTGSPQTQDTRLELLKLVHRHDRDAKTLIGRARELEEYVNGESSAPEKSGGDGQGEHKAPV